MIHAHGWRGDTEVLLWPKRQDHALLSWAEELLPEASPCCGEPPPSALKGKGCSQIWTSQWFSQTASFRSLQTCTWKSLSGWVSTAQVEQISKLCREVASKLQNWFPLNQSLNSEHLLKNLESGKDLSVHKCPSCLRHTTSVQFLELSTDLGLFLGLRGSKARVGTWSQKGSGVDMDLGTKNVVGPLSWKLNTFPPTSLMPPGWPLAHFVHCDRGKMWV